MAMLSLRANYYEDHFVEQKHLTESFAHSPEQFLQKLAVKKWEDLWAL